MKSSEWGLERLIKRMVRSAGLQRVGDKDISEPTPTAVYRPIEVVGDSAVPAKSGEGSEAHSGEEVLDGSTDGGDPGSPSECARQLAVRVGG